MNVVHRLVVAGLVVGLGALSDGADAARTTTRLTATTGNNAPVANLPAAAATPHGHAVRGVVEHVNHHKHEIRIRIHGHDGHHHHEVTFHVNHATRFEIVHGKNEKPAHFRDVHHGEHVVIHHVASHPHVATEVAIFTHGHHKK
jgi:hypothetical protein